MGPVTQILVVPQPKKNVSVQALSDLQTYRSPCHKGERSARVYMKFSLVNVYGLFFCFLSLSVHAASAQAMKPSYKYQ